MSPAKTVIGYKIRDIGSGSFFNKPAGIPHTDTIPFIAIEQEDTPIAVICEGETDALAFASLYPKRADVFGVPGATAFPNEWASLFVNYPFVYLIPDSDPAGEKMVQKVCALIPRCKVVRLPEGMDVCDMVVKNPEALTEAYSKAERVVIKTPLKLAKRAWVPDETIDTSKLIDFARKDVQFAVRGNELVGLCPFHEEDTPSFFVSMKKHLFKCHGCGFGGDVIEYVKRRYQVDYREARDIIDGRRRIPTR